MNFNKKCSNCSKNKISIIRVFLIIHDLLKNRITCKNCKSNFKIKDKSLKKYKYLMIFLVLIYLVGFFSILIIQNEVLGVSFNFIGILLGLSFMLAIEYIISKKITLEEENLN